MAPNQSNNIEPYTLLRASLALFEKSPAELDPEQLLKAQIQARNEFAIETRVLNSVEASSVIISDYELERALTEVRQRFENEQEFEDHLLTQSLTLDSLKAALFRQCKVDAVMEKIASRTPKISEVEVGIFYHSHREKFNLPERRQARHILISINPDYPENTREKSLERIQSIAETLKRKPHKFPDLALKNSECPTAMNGGNLGEIVQGKLFPELDEVLFKLRENEISQPVETEIGYHLIQCLKIQRAETLSLQKATPKIRKIMQERSRRICQRSWLASLPDIGSTKSGA
ncbi:MAG: nitrogen fixation protein NifM [Methylococcaceae bacterium]|nr:nitrogen fixation protein NifM [Methylococcaceae bacterium]